MAIILKNIPSPHPMSISIMASDTNTLSGVTHRELLDNGHNNILLEYMLPALEEHHISPDNLKRHKELISSLRIANVPTILSPYPKSPTTQKGNFAEIFLAEYLGATTGTDLPIYRLRYNTNPDQSMKGDDVLLFDLDSEPIRIIVGESKFRGTPDKKAVTDIVNSLMRSNKEGLPISLMFVAQRLFEEGEIELGKKVQNCSLLFANNRLHIDYVGFLMSNHKAKDKVNTYTTNTLNNLLMISLGMQNPQEVIKEAFGRLEENI